MKRKGDVKRITPAQLRDLRAQHNDLPLIDVRDPFELQAFGKIPGVINIPLGSLSVRVTELPADRSRPVVLVCQSGARSLSAARILIDHGYSDVYSLDGGTSAWLQAYGRGEGAIAR